MDNNGFWDAKLKNLKLIVKHPVSGLPCLRWHQPWDETKTKFSTCDVTIENDDNSLVQVVDRVTYDYRVCLRLGWEKGDLLVSDNTPCCILELGISVTVIASCGVFTVIRYLSSFALLWMIYCRFLFGLWLPLVCVHMSSLFRSKL